MEERIMPHQTGWSTLLSGIKEHLNSTRPERPKRGFISYAWEQDATQYGFLLMESRTSPLTLEGIPELPYGATYIKTQVNTKDRLYYLYYKGRTTLTLIDITPKKAEELKKLDPTAGIINQHKHLERHELQIINDHLGHNQMEKNKELQTWIKTLQEDLQAAAMEEVFLDIKNMHGELKNTMSTNIQHSDIIFFICNPRFKERFSECCNTGLLVLSMLQSKSTKELENAIKTLELPYQNIYIQVRTDSTTSLYYKNAWGLHAIDVTPSMLSELSAAITKPAEHKLLSPIELQRITAITGHAHNNLVFEVHTVLEEKRRRPSLNVMWLLQSGIEAKSVPDGLMDSPLFKIRGPYNPKRFTGFRTQGLLDKICGTGKDADYRQLLYRYYLSVIPTAPKIFGREQELQALTHQVKRKAISYLVGESGVGTSALAMHFANTVYHPDTPGTHFPLVRYLPVGSEEAWVTLVATFAKELDVPTHKWWDTLLTLPTKWLLIVDSGSIRIGWEPIFKSSAYQHRLLRVQQPSIESPKLITLSPLPETARLQMLKHYLGSHDADAEQALVVKYFGSLQNLIAAINYIRKSPWLDVTRFLKYTLDVPHEPMQATPKQALIQNVSNEPIDDEDAPDKGNQSKWQVLKSGVKQLIETRALTVGILHTSADSSMAEKLRDDLQDCGITVHLFQTTPFPTMDALIIVTTPNFKPQCSPELELAITDLPLDAVYPLIAGGDFGSAVPRFLGAYLVGACKDGYEQALLALEPLGILAAICGFKEGHPYEHHWTYYRLSNLPTLDTKLIGRTQTLTDIKCLLESQEELLDTKLVAITGMGGFGKSSVVLMYAHRYRNQYDFIRVLNSEGTALISSLLSLASDLGIETRGKAIHDVLSSLYTELDKIPSYLLIFDNIETFEQLKPYLPDTNKANQHVLVTSRDNASWQKKIEFKEFTPDEAQEFLQREIDETSEELAEEVGRLPLALNTAVAFIKEQRKQVSYTIEQYLIDYRSKKMTSTTSAVFTSLQLALPKIEAQSQDALNLIRYCAFLSPEHIVPEWLVHDQLLGAMPRIYTALTVVANFSMLTVKNYELEMHRLMQKAIRESIPLSSEQILENYLLPLTEAIRAPYAQTKSNHSDYDTSKIFIPHMVWLNRHLHDQKVLSDEAQLKNVAARGILLDCLGNAYSSIGNFAQACMDLQESLVVKRKRYGREHLEYVNTLLTLADAYGSLGNYSEQIQRLEEAIDVYKRCHALKNREKLYQQTLNDLIKACELLGGAARDKIYAALAVAQEEIDVSRILLSTLDQSPVTCEQINQILPTLLAAIKHTDDDIRGDVCNTLVKLELSPEQGNQRFLALLATTQDKNWFSSPYGCGGVRYIAYKSLDKLKLSPEQTSQWLSALLAATKDEDKDVRQLAYKSMILLEVSAEQTSQWLLALLAAGGNTICEALAKLELSPEQTNQRLLILLAAIKDEDKWGRKAIYEALAALSLSSEQTNQRLLALLVATKDEDEDARRAAYEALSKLELSPEQTNQRFLALLAAIKNEDEYGRAVIYEALAKLELSPEQTNQWFLALLPAIKEEYWHVRKIAYEALAKLELSLEQTNQLFLALLTAIQDEHEEVRQSADEALAKLALSSEQTNQLFLVLLVVTKDEDVDVRQGAYKALAKLELSLEQTNQRFLALLVATKDEDKDARKAAYEALSKLELSPEQTNQWLLALLAATKDEYEMVRQAVYGSLAKPGLSPEQTNQCFLALLQAIKDENWYARKIAYKALAKLDLSLEQTNQLFLALLAVIKDEDVDVRHDAYETLDKLELSLEQTNQLFPVLLQVTKDENKSVRPAAYEALVKLDLSPEQASQWFLALLQAIQEGWYIRNISYEALAKQELSLKQTNQLFLALLEATKDENSWVRLAAYQALANLKLSSEQSSQLFLELLVAIKAEDTVGRREAYAALAKLELSSEQTNQLFLALFALVKDEVGWIRTDAYAALAKLELSPKQTNQRFLELFVAIKNNIGDAYNVISELELSPVQTRSLFLVLLVVIKDETRCVKSRREDRSRLQAAYKILATLELSPEQTNQRFLILLMATKNEDGHVRDTAYRALAKLELSPEQISQCLSTLLQALKDGNWFVREGVCETLAELALSSEQTSQLFPILLQVTRDEDSRIRVAAYNALAKLELSLEQTNQFFAAIKDEETWLKMTVYKAMAQLDLSLEQTSQLFLELLVATKNENVDVGRDAYETLAKLKLSPEQTDQLFPVLLQVTRDKDTGFSAAYYRVAAYEALAKLALSLEQTSQLFLALLAAIQDSGYVEVRQSAYKVLAKLELSPEQTNQRFLALLAATKDRYVLAKLAAYEAMTKLESSSEQTNQLFLISLTIIKGGNPLTKLAAYAAIATLELSPEQTSQLFLLLLQAATQDENGSVRKAAYGALAKLELTQEQTKQLLLSSALLTTTKDECAEAVAILYARSSKFTKQLEMLEQVLKIKKKYFGGKHTEYAQMLILLANYYVGVGKIDTAIAYFAKALPIIKKEYGIRQNLYKDCFKQQQQAQEKLAIIHTGIGGSPTMLLRARHKEDDFDRKDELIKSDSAIPDDSLCNIPAKQNTRAAATTQLPISAAAAAIDIGFFSSSTTVGTTAKIIYSKEAPRTEQSIPLPL